MNSLGSENHSLNCVDVVVIYQNCLGGFLYRYLYYPSTNLPTIKQGRISPQKSIGWQSAIECQWIIVKRILTEYLHEILLNYQHLDSSISHHHLDVLLYKSSCHIPTCVMRRDLRNLNKTTIPSIINQQSSLLLCSATSLAVIL